MDFWKKGRLGEKAVEDLQKILKLILASCAKETSSDPDNWSESNPLHGHCAIIAILMNKLIGGKIMRASLESVKGYEQMRSHYWNLLPNGIEIDLSSGQFKGDDRSLVPQGKTTKRDKLTRKNAAITAEGLLEYEPTAKRFELFKNRFMENFHKNRPGCSNCGNCKKKCKDK